MPEQHNTPDSELLYWFIFDKQNLLVRKEGDSFRIPLLTRDAAKRYAADGIRGIGAAGGIRCCAAVLNSELGLEEPFSLAELRPLFGLIDFELFWMGARALHLLHWDSRSRFCGVCGSPNREKGDEIAKVCASCGEIVYPRISPAVIVAVVKDGKILLANANRFNAKLYSVIAGFVEPGESLEQCVHREVMEEMGIRVKNVRYFDSQPWPFPDSLMAGFTAEYESGTLTVDKRENDHADWFAPDELPKIPAKVSIARRLIDWFIAEYGR